MIDSIPTAGSVGSSRYDCTIFERGISSSESGWPLRMLLHLAIHDDEQEETDLRLSLNVTLNTLRFLTRKM